MVPHISHIKYIAKCNSLEGSPGGAKKIIWVDWIITAGFQMRREQGKWSGYFYFNVYRFPEKNFTLSRDNQKCVLVKNNFPKWLIDLKTVFFLFLFIHYLKL